ncbi:hypothetical protein ACOME3_004564 [Neoechinorhynchus agilis]
MNLGTMARLGEGDPRWIVEDRPDSVNVNNWHWREKSADSWSQDFFKSAIASIRFENKFFRGKFEEVSLMEGDSMVCNRKGKLIVVFDWNLTISYQVESFDCSGTSKGKLTVFELTHDVKDWTKEVRADVQDEDDLNVRSFVLKEGFQSLVPLFKRYHEDLLQYAKDLILPTKKSNDVHLIVDRYQEEKHGDMLESSHSILLPSSRSNYSI